MKKILFLLLSATVLFSACKKETDRVFNESYSERVNGNLNKYRSAITGSPYGWKGLITTADGTGGSYSFYMKFNDSNRVTMVSDFDSVSAKTPQASSFRIRQQQQPTLVFDTYSYVHVLADPNENVVIEANINGGPVGEGLLSDFEFIINPETFTGDTLKLTGKVNGARLVLTKATQAEASEYLAGNWQLKDTYFNKLLTYYKKTTIGGVLYDVSNDPFARTITFQKVEGGTTRVRHTTPYFNTLDGIGLFNPLQTGSGSVNQIKITSWDPSGILTVKFNEEEATLTEEILPQDGGLDLNAPQDWWNTANNVGTYWRTWEGFHQNGVDNAFNLTGLTAPGVSFFVYFIYWPNFAEGENDFFAPVFVNAAQTSLTYVYAAAPAIPTWSDNGIQRFISLGNYGTYPTAATNAARRMRNLFFQAAGFYFVKIDDTNYDMVYALNGKSWLRWELQP